MIIKPFQTNQEVEINTLFLPPVPALFEITDDGDMPEQHIQTAIYEDFLRDLQQMANRQNETSIRFALQMLMSMYTSWLEATNKLASIEQIIHE